MFQRIFYKIWFAFFITLLLSVIAFFMVMDISFKREFYRYASKQAMASLVRLEDSLLEYQNQHGSLVGLSERPKYWNKLKNRAFDYRIKIKNPPPHKKNKIDHHKTFVKGIILVDNQKQLIVGRLSNRLKYSWHAIKHNKSIIGYLGYVKPKHLLRSVDLDFAQKHIKRLIIICIGLLLVSMLVATVIARRISKPIKQVSLAANSLAAGDYSVRLQPNSADEIGSLCTTVNHLAQALESNERMRNQWVADISHEMRTPVSVLKAQIEAIEDGIREPNEKNMKVLHRNVCNLSALIDDLFELSLSDVGALNYKKEPLLIQPLIEGVLESFSQNLLNANLTLNYELSILESVSVVADEKRLKQLFENILENSIRYTHGGGCIQMKCTETDDQWHFIVEDSAPGVEPSKHEKIFDRLYRVEVSRSRETGGAGLGLAICKNIVIAHQGKLWAEESAFGGLAIHITLPKNKG